MKCKCGEQGELKIFNTFQYYYCNKCKAEIETPEENPFDPFDPNTGSIDDFYFDLSRTNLEKALKNISEGFKNDGLVTITLPNPLDKGYRFYIYRNHNPIPQIYESDGKKCKNVSLNN